MSYSKRCVVTSHKIFSHIYIEEEIANHPNTLVILARFKNAQIIHIKHYKDIFNRKNQSQAAQKESKKLILTKKRTPFIYKGSGLIQDFGFEQYLYTPTMMNCIYDCDYCILQGMYGSANLIFFVNIEEYFESLKEIEGRAHLSISYDTDLMAFEKIFGVCRAWIEEIEKYPDITLEIRTKSANFDAIADMEHRRNVILSWTLLPEFATKKYERNTPETPKRLDNIKKALQKGWRVRICIDPVIEHENFEETYSIFIENLFKEIGNHEIEDIALGVFRINSDFLKKMKKREIRSDILYYPYNVEDGVATYREERRMEMLEFVSKKLEKYVKREKIFISEK